MSSASHHRQWSVAKFECERAHLCEFLKGPIQAIEQGKRRILIRAPVKSGKRQMVEYLAMRDNTSHPTRKHKFLTQWHRKADEDQRAELKCYGIEVLSGITDKKKDDYNNKIRDTLSSDPRVTLIVHIDECDHGSGIRQAMAHIWRTWREDERVIFILYSATPEEVIYSREIAEVGTAAAAAENGDDEEMIEEFGEGVRFDYTPQDTFCGPARFLDAGLVSESRPFFEKVPQLQQPPAGAPQLPPFFRLTAQGREIIANLRREIETGRSDRNILLIRLSYGDSDMAKPNAKENKAIYQFLKNIRMFTELEGCSIYVDKDEQPSGIDSDVVISMKIQWSNPRWWGDLTTRRPIIIVHDQTFSRSTEYACHDRTFATHDYRNQITFSISSQAVERMNHYSTRYASGFQPIQIYCHRNTLLLSAGRISYEEFLYNEWEMKKVQPTGQRRRLGNQPQQPQQHLEQPQQPQQPQLQQPRLQPSMFRIQRSDRTHRIHPDHPNPMTETEARAVLMDLCCEKRPPKLSARITGDIDDHVIIDSRQVLCASAAEFERLAQEGQLNGKSGQTPAPGRNPFESYAPNPEDLDRRFKSNIRGVRKARTVAEVEHENWGISAIYHTRRHICYNEDGECVVLIQSFDGYREVDGLTTQGSMYRPRVTENTSSASSEGSVSD
jgi:hypothetical protein